jgi:hypothetical protein
LASVSDCDGRVNPGTLRRRRPNCLLDAGVIMRGKHAALVPVTSGGHLGWVHSTSVCYVTGSSGAPQTLWRIASSGGTPESIWNDPNRPPSGAMATDECSIYWLVGTSAYTPVGNVNGPSTSMVRAAR